MNRIEKDLHLGGREVKVDIYVPRTAGILPVAVVSHGFTRSRLNMAGWGTLLAANGFLTAVPDLPAWADPERNSRALGELMQMMLQGGLLPRAAVTKQGALIGFSLGGLCTMLAAALNGNTRCWIGLDPVHGGKETLAVASRLSVPGAVLMAEAGACNVNGCAQEIIEALRGPVVSLRVARATHCDCENPTDWTAEMVCGQSDPARRAVFEKYTLAALRAAFFRDTRAQEELLGAGNDPSVKDVWLRDVEGFGLGAPT